VRKQRQLTILLILIGLLGVLIAPQWDQNCSAESIREIISLSDNKHTRFSIHFCDPRSGQTIYAHNADVPLTPASNIKILTTSAAIDQLGAEFIYETVFALMGEDLAIFAGGDPLTGDPVLAERDKRDINTIFQQLFEQLKQRKIKRIRGNLLIDDFIFDDQRFHRSWPIEDADNWYAAQISALCFNDNCVDITVSPAPRAGEPALIASDPDTSYVKIINESRTVGTGSNTATAFCKVPEKTIRITGKVRKSETFSPLPVERPSAFFGHVMAEYLLERGIRIDGKLIIKKLRDDRGRLPGNLDVLYTHQTPLKDVLLRANSDSLNLVAECLFKTLGAYHHLPADSVLQRGTWQSGRIAVIDFLDKLQIEPIHYEIDDGSGLSRHNRMSARCLTTILGYMYRHRQAAVFRTSLATPITRGTLRRAIPKRFRETTYRRRIQVKTGYMKGIWALSGYAQTKNGRWLVFSILANRSSPQKMKHSPREYIDRMVKAVIDN
jgi:serine-type D-Ala-D-Ala carboxypeptidase/endopeptidase (penicillin-binding protein 4)